MTLEAGAKGRNVRFLSGAKTVISPTVQPQLFLNMRVSEAWNKQWRSFSKAWSESNKNTGDLTFR
jgi:hypothetical protein